MSCTTPRGQPRRTVYTPKDPETLRDQDFRSVQWTETIIFGKGHMYRIWHDVKDGCGDPCSH
jgi:hypothetical protein